jgi:hypothetical protein
MRHTQILFFRYFLIIFSYSFLLLPAIALSALEIKLSDTHIQSRLVKHFPIREYAAFARITLHEPQVILSRDAKDLLLIIPVDASIPDQSLQKGHARIAVKVAYRPGNGGLYLSNPRVIEFEMPQVSNNMNLKLKSKITTMCLNSLPLIQIFKLEEKALKHSLAKSNLKSYSINDGSLVMTFGFD